MGGGCGDGRCILSRIKDDGGHVASKEIEKYKVKIQVLSPTMKIVSMSVKLSLATIHEGGRKGLNRLEWV